MAQSAADSKKTPLHIEAFWEKPTATPTLTWDKWTQNWKLALLAKEGIQLDTLLDDPPASVNYITSYQQLYQQVYDSNYESDSDDYVAAISSDSVHQLEPLNVEVQIGEIQTSAMIDSGSAVSIVTKSLANRILQSTKSARWTDS